MTSQHVRGAWVRAAITVALAATSAGCHRSSVRPDAGPAPDAGRAEDAGVSTADPDAGEDWGFDASFLFDDDAGPVDPTRHPHVIYLNTSGRAWTNPLRPDGSGEVPAFMTIHRGRAPLEAFEGDWRARRRARVEDLVDRVAARFEGLDVTVVDRRPPTEGYIEVLIGGDDADRGAASACGGRLGFASLLCGSVDRDERRLGHVLSGCLASWGSFESDQARLAAIAAHEVGHAVGLEHIDAAGVIMSASGSSGAREWGVGRVVPWEPGSSDVVGRGDCGRVSQDSRRVLEIQLGAARPREPVPPPPDLEPPRFTARPRDGDRMPPGAEPCVRVTSDAELAGAVHLETFVRLPDGSAYVRLAHDAAPAPDARFSPLPDAPEGSELRLRLTVADVHGNLAEERVRVVLDPSAEAPRCE
ncbi:MAG TPA: matrixin family metalloprotease [Sandaracinaceae bacterium LLY-WYZ-13_1]|nr:matrixin family metalloprotease [Sandaracinaceae bacterium LLY-WYZ-13_1]